MRNQTRQLITAVFPNALWLSGAVSLVLFSWILTRLSTRFGYDWAVIDMPIRQLTALLVSAGLVFFFAACFALHRRQHAPTSNVKIALSLVLISGLIARVILLFSEPALENDYQRYLWDGAVTAHGFNPYQHTPKSVIDGGSAHPLAAVAEEAGPVLPRINHRELTTIYPPVTQTAFALAYYIEPFSLLAWRGVLLAADSATLGLLLLLLSVLNRSPLWSALYWWNPVVLKEFFNSAHMDGLILPFVLGALYLAIKKRPIWATTSLAFGIGVKIWPVLLLPLIWRAAITNTRQFWLCVTLFTTLMVLWLAPYVAAGFTESSGTAAYVQRWTINSPLFTTLRGGMRWVIATLGFPDQAKDLGSLITRALMALTAGIIALKMAVRPITTPQDMMGRALIIVAALVFLAPAIYPWYTLWMAPLLVLTPHLGLLLLFATIPFYYTYFYFAARSTTALYQNGIVWLVWLPVWGWCFASWVLDRRKVHLKPEPQPLKVT